MGKGKGFVTVGVIVGYWARGGFIKAFSGY